MAVTPDDVRHVAALARLRVPEERLSSLAGELSGILAHMEVLAKARTGDVEPIAGVGAAGLPLRPDQGPAVALRRERADFAPDTRDGFFLVPRLATHAAAGGAAVAGGDDEVEG